MQSHLNKDEWEQLPLDDLFRVLLEISPKKTTDTGQPTLAYLKSEAKKFVFDVLIQGMLVRQFVQVETKLEAIQHSTNDEAFAIRQLTNDIPLGTGSD